MRKLPIVCALAFVSLAAPAVVGADTYAIDTAHSTVMFKVKHVGVANFYGRFNGLTGEFTFDSANPAASSFSVSIDAESVDTHNEKRDQHLKSPDFLHSKQFPAITMKSKSVKKTGDNTFRVTADLTLRGVTKEISFDLTHVGAGKDQRGNALAGFETQFTIQRSAFDVKFMPDGLGEDVTILVSIEGRSKPA